MMRIGSDTNRGTGRTQRIIEEAVASDAELVAVVMRDPTHITTARERIEKLLPGGVYKPASQEFIRSDGRRIRLTYSNGAPFHLRGLKPEVFVDHAASEPKLL